MTPTTHLAALGLAAAALLPLPALAGPGHDHGHGHDTPATAGPALPRFAASSESFELVGVLDGRQLTLYLDRAADNAPVIGAQIELEIGGAPHKATVQDEVYALTLPAAPQPGVLPVTATITAGAEMDLLAAELEIPEATPAGAAAHGHDHGALEIAAGVAGAVAALAALGFAGRRVVAGRRARTGAAA